MEWLRCAQLWQPWSFLRRGPLRRAENRSARGFNIVPVITDKGQYAATAPPITTRRTSTVIRGLLMYTPLAIPLSAGDNIVHVLLAVPALVIVVRHLLKSMHPESVPANQAGA
jgi:hypothetical protein